MRVRLERFTRLIQSSLFHLHIVVEAARHTSVAIYGALAAASIDVQLGCTSDIAVVPARLGRRRALHKVLTVHVRVLLLVQNSEALAFNFYCSAIGSLELFLDYAGLIRVFFKVAHVKLVQLEASVVIGRVSATF